VNRLLPSLATLAVVTGFAILADAQPPADEPPIERLMESLADPDSAKRVEAARALEELGPDAAGAVTALVEAIKDEEPDVRAAVAGALGAIGPDAEAAVSAMIEALNDDGITTSDKIVWRVVGRALGRIGPVAVPNLIVALESSDYRVCQGAAVALHDIGPDAKDAVGGLIQVVKLDDFKTRKAAIYGLMGIGPAAQPAVPVLVGALTHEDLHVRYWAEKALGGIGPNAQEAVPALLERLTKGCALVRLYAAQALGDIGPGIGSEAVAALIEALADPVQPVREEAVIALGKLRSHAAPAIPVIRRAVEDRTIRPPVEAAIALWRLTGETDTVLSVLLEQIQGPDDPFTAALAFKRLGPAVSEAVPKVAELLESDDPLTRTCAAVALGQMGPMAKPAVAALDRRLEDEDSDVRATAAEALQLIGRP